MISWSRDGTPRFDSEFQRLTRKTIERTELESEMLACAMEAGICPSVAATEILDGASGEERLLKMIEQSISAKKAAADKKAKKAKKAKPTKPVKAKKNPSPDDDEDDDHDNNDDDADDDGFEDNENDDDVGSDEEDEDEDEEADEEMTTKSATMTPGEADYFRATFGHAPTKPRERRAMAHARAHRDAARDLDAMSDRERTAALCGFQGLTRSDIRGVSVRNVDSEPAGNLVPLERLGGDVRMDIRPISLSPMQEEALRLAGRR